MEAEISSRALKCSSCYRPSLLIEGEGQNSIKLGCGHSMCFSCLQSQWLSSGYNDSESIRCVTCAFTTSISDAPTGTKGSFDSAINLSSDTILDRNSNVVKWDRPSIADLQTRYVTELSSTEAKERDIIGVSSSVFRTIPTNRQRCVEESGVVKCKEENNNVHFDVESFEKCEGLGFKDSKDCQQSLKGGGIGVDVNYKDNETEKDSLVTVGFNGIANGSRVLKLPLQYGPKEPRMQTSYSNTRKSWEDLTVTQISQGNTYERPCTQRLSEPGNDADFKEVKFSDCFNESRNYGRLENIPESRSDEVLDLSLSKNHSFLHSTMIEDKTLLENAHALAEAGNIGGDKRSSFAFETRQHSGITNTDVNQSKVQFSPVAVDFDGNRTRLAGTQHLQLSSVTSPYLSVSGEINDSLYQTCLEPCEGDGIMGNDNPLSVLDFSCGNSKTSQQDRLQNSTPYLPDSHISAQNDTWVNPNSTSTLSCRCQYGNHVCNERNTLIELQSCPVEGSVKEKSLYNLPTTSDKALHPEDTESIHLLCAESLNRFKLHLDQIKSTDRKTWHESHNIYFQESITNIERLVVRVALLNDKYKQSVSQDDKLGSDMMEVLYLCLSNLIFAHLTFKRVCSLSHTALNEQLTFYPDVLVNAVQNLMQQSILATSLVCNVSDDIAQQYQIKHEKSMEALQRQNHEESQERQDTGVKTFLEHTGNKESHEDRSEAMSEDTVADIAKIVSSKTFQQSGKNEKDSFEDDCPLFDIAISNYLQKLERKKSLGNNDQMATGENGQLVSCKRDGENLLQPSKLHVLCNKKLQKIHGAAEIRSKQQKEKILSSLPDKTAIDIDKTGLRCRVVCSRVDDFIDGIDKGSSVNLSADYSKQITETDKRSRGSSPFVFESVSKQSGFGSCTDLLNECRIGAKRHGPMESQSTENCSPAKRKLVYQKDQKACHSKAGEDGAGMSSKAQPKSKKELFSEQLHKDITERGNDNIHCKSINSTHNNETSFDAFKSNLSIPDQTVSTTKNVSLIDSDQADVSARRHSASKKLNVDKTSCVRKCVSSCAAPNQDHRKTMVQPISQKHEYSQRKGSAKSHREPLHSSASKVQCLKKGERVLGKCTTREDDDPDKVQSLQKSKISHACSEHCRSSDISLSDRHVSEQERKIFGLPLTKVKQTCPDKGEIQNQGKTFVIENHTSLLPSTKLKEVKKNGQNLTKMSASKSRYHCQCIQTHLESNLERSGSRTPDTRSGQSVTRIVTHKSQDSLPTGKKGMTDKVTVVQNHEHIRRSMSVEGHSNKMKRSKVIVNTPDSSQVKAKDSVDNSGKALSKSEPSGSEQKKNREGHIKQLSYLSDSRKRKEREHGMEKSDRNCGKVEEKSVGKSSDVRNKDGKFVHREKDKNHVSVKGSTKTKSEKNGSESKTRDLEIDKKSTKSRTDSSGHDFKDDMIAHKSSDSGKGSNQNVPRTKTSNSCKNKKIKEKTEDTNVSMAAVYDFVDDNVVIRNKLISLNRKELGERYNPVTDKSKDRQQPHPSAGKTVKKTRNHPKDGKYRSILSDSSSTESGHEDVDDDGHFPPRFTSITELDLPSLSHSGRLSSEMGDGKKKRCRRLDPDTLLQIRHIFGVDFDLHKYGNLNSSVTKPPVHKVEPFKQKEEVDCKSEGSIDFKGHSENNKTFICGESTGITDNNRDQNNNDTSIRHVDENGTRKKAQESDSFISHIDSEYDISSDRSSCLQSSRTDSFITDSSQNISGQSDSFVSDTSLSLSSQESGCERKRRKTRGKVTCSSSDEIIPARKERGFQHVDKCFSILNRLYNNVHGEPFCHEVKSRDVPDYYKVIKRGMCFDMIAYKLRNNIYQEINEFVSDMRLIFHNCRLYHQSDTHIYRCGEKMEKWFVYLFKKTFPESLL